MTYKGLILKSRTIDLTVLVAGLGAAIQYLPMIKENLGDYYGYVFIAVGIAFAVLRKVTTKPLGEK